MSRFASTATKASYDPIFQSYHLGRLELADLLFIVCVVNLYFLLLCHFPPCLLTYFFTPCRSVDLKQVEGLFDLTKSAGKGSVSFTTATPGAGFDVYGFGSVVFYNTSNDFHQQTLAKINTLELSPNDAANAIEGYNFECSAQVGNPLNDPQLSAGEKEKLESNIVVSVEKNRPAGYALAQVVALDYVDVALDRIIENISNLDEAGLSTAVKHLAGIMGSIEGRTIPKFDDATNELAYKGEYTHD